MGYNGLRKIQNTQMKWTEKGVKRHKHDFSIHTIMSLRNMENRIEYYDIMKCKYCNSFHSISKEGSITGFITEEDYLENYSHLPILHLYRSHKHSIGFNDMELDVGQ